MKILIITPLYPGYKDQSNREVPYAVHQFSKIWFQYGHEVRVIRIWPFYPRIIGGQRSRQYLSYKSFEMDNIRIIRTPIYKLPRMNFLNKDIIKVYNRIVEELPNSFIPDVIINHTFNPALFISSQLKQKFKAPIIVTLHNTDIVGLTKRRQYKKKYNNFEGVIDRIGFRSPKIKNSYFNIFKVNKESKNDSFILPSGIEKENIITREAIKTKAKKPIKSILIASNMTKGKNVDTLIKAFSKIPLKYSLTLKIAGDGPERKNLNKLVKRLNLQQKVQFLGHISREEVLEHMEESGVFAMVSSPETFGLVYVEAMGKGCITIGSKGEGIDGTIIDGENGFLSESGDVNGLKDTLIKVLNLDEIERELITNKALETAESQTLEQLAGYYLEVMKDTINNVIK